MDSTLIPMLLAVIASQKYAPNTKETFKKEYDYVIVGAGGAGAVVASRLSERCCVDVLVLEAGKSPPPMSEIPGTAKDLLKTEVNWKFISEPQNYTGAQLIDRRIPLPAGKAIGGSSIVNTMMFIRGNHRDYDDWEKMGAKNWAWKKVFPYFLKLENNSDPDIANNGYHHVGGPMTASRPRYIPEVKPAFLEAFKSLRYKYLDSNGATQIGFDDYQTFIRDGRRCSTAKAYLVPVDDRPNLDIIAQAFVKKIRIRSKKAEGVYFDYNGTSHYVTAKREVIVSAGAIKTPQILMLSGIGPKKTLEKFNIRVKANLPVGQNFQDHVTAVLFASVEPPVQPYKLKLENPLNIVEYATNSSGLKTCLRIFRTPEVQQAGVKPFETLMPGCEDFAKNEDMYLECYVRAFAWSISHQSSTAKMGDPNDSTTVVDPELRVKGIGNLRIIDASVMPKIVSGNLNIPIVMIAEKASDIIKKSILSC